MTPEPINTDGTLTSYAAQRLAEIGMTFEDTELPQFNNEEATRAHKTPIVRADAQDNMVFAYPGLDGHWQTYQKGQKEVHYEVVRLKSPDSDRKYLNPKDSASRIFLTPKVFHAWEKSKEIDTLFVIEGQLKALAGAHYGAYMVGISGIWNFQDGKALKRDLERIIVRCKVKRVVLMFDADARVVKPEYVAEGRDLAARLRQFYGALMAFREAAQSLRTTDWDGPEVYYAQVKHGSEHKGLDDLLAAQPNKEERAKMIEHLCALKPKSEWFEVLNCSAKGPGAIKSHFQLGHYTSFYNAYEKEIGEEEFVWQGGRYKLSHEGVVEQLAHPESVSYIRVSSDYYKVIYGTTAYGTETRSVKMWKKGEISGDYGQKFLQMVERYDEFCNIPQLPNGEHTIEVITKHRNPVSGSEIVFRHYNLYNPLPYKPERGSWVNIEGFMRHIFREQYELATDWVQLMYQQPTQKLPIICLVSNERGTGKTTFLKLMNIIFGSNAIVIGNDDFNGDFNSHFVSKLFVGIDEGFIEKKAVLETIKSMNTRDRIGLHAKGKDKSEVDCLMHFALTSNNVDNFLHIDAEENRFWVRHVHRQEGEENPDLLDQMKAEVPAYLEFLSRRQISAPKRTRFWFDYQSYRTEALDRVVQESRSGLDKALDITLERIATERGEARFFMTPSEIQEALKKDSGQSFPQGWLLKVLRSAFGDNKQRRVEVATDFTKSNGISRPTHYESRVGRYFDLDLAKWYSPADMANLRTFLPPPEPQPTGPEAAPLLPPIQPSGTDLPPLFPEVTPDF